MQRFVDEELVEPEQIAHMHRLAESEGLANLLLDLHRDRQRQVCRGIARREVKEKEQDETDEQQGRNSERQSADGVVEHAVRPSPVPTRKRHWIRCQSAMFQISLSQVLSRTPPSELAWAETRPRWTSGIIA